MRAPALALQRLLQPRRAPVGPRALSTGGPERGEQSYEEVAKQQMRSYQKWRTHFRWSRARIAESLRDYALWTVLGLLAYYNMTKRHELQDYEAESFVAIDKLEGQIHALDPHNRLLQGTVRDRRDAAPSPPSPRTGSSAPAAAGPPVFY
ncbi:hypothetical protein H4R21_002791 [Coemansia helicoidea]|uniref:Uncharacterized protein n=1 Tax=Coemansia helicoidea TaxID=1286919 RepID=A0ACC1L6D7_9FUNG|nr:hypothetical protein H4R21_002791 [Coemansia helicoidea]